MLEEETVLKKGREMVLLELMPTCRVRLIRCIVYEGTYEQVKGYVKNSKEIGPHFSGSDPGCGFTIYQDDYEVIPCTTEK